MDFLHPRSWCPLCPYKVQTSVAQLARHLSTSHAMNNSAIILARIMVSTPLGQQEVSEVLKDVKNLNATITEKELDLRNLGKTYQRITVKLSELMKLGQTNQKVDNSSQTEEDNPTDFSDTQASTTTSDLEIEELKQIISAKKTSVKILDNQISDTEAQLHLYKSEDLVDENSNNSESGLKKDLKTDEKREAKSQFPKQKNENVSVVAILKDELKAARDENLKKDEELATWKEIVHELNKKLEIGIKEKMSAHEHIHKLETDIESVTDKSNQDVSKIVKEKDFAQKISAQLIESQRIVHEKELQDLNKKLQNQINRSQVLKTKEKTFLEEIESLGAEHFKKSDMVQSLSTQVDLLKSEIKELKLKISEQSVKSSKDNLRVVLENIDVKEAEIYRLHEKIASLDTMVKALGKNTNELKDELVKKSKEKVNLEQQLFKSRELSEEKILEKDKLLGCLGKELKNTKADVGTQQYQLSSATLPVICIYICAHLS